MRTFSEEEIRAEIERQHNGVIWLENSNRLSLVPPNNPRAKVPSHLDRIFTYLDSPTLPGGVYYIKSKPSHQKRGEPLVMAYEKKGDLRESENPTVYRPFNTSPEPMTWQQILQIQSENAKLQGTNEMLVYQVGSLQAKIEMLEEIIDDLRESNNDLSEAVQPPISPLKGLAESLAPFAPVLVELLTRKNQTPSAPVVDAPAGGINPDEFNQMKEIISAQTKSINQIVSHLRTFISSTQTGSNGAESEPEPESENQS